MSGPIGWRLWIFKLLDVRFGSMLSKNAVA
jgi:hypothetical protein